MAIYHMQAKVVSRGSGRSAVAASAYMSCSRMYNDYDGIQHDYTRKQGLIYQEVMLPSMAPLEWNSIPMEPLKEASPPDRSAPAFWYSHAGCRHNHCTCGYSSYKQKQQRQTDRNHG